MINDQCADYQLANVIGYLICVICESIGEICGKIFKIQGSKFKEYRIQDIECRMIDVHSLMINGQYADDQLANDQSAD